MKILFVGAGGKQYGGKAYEKIAKDVMSRHFQVDEIALAPSNTPSWLKLPLAFIKLLKLSRKTDYDIIVKNFDSCLFINKKPTKTIAVVHHIDYSFTPPLIKFISFFTTPIILRNLRKVDTIVVVSKYWADWFKKRGYNNVHIIYNAFETEKINLKKPEIYGKPTIYLGNNQKAKGADESRKALNGVNANLVSFDNLPYEDYIKILITYAIVITMSKFPEGWCRVAHEAMLLKIPVIGSGKGGMRELLEGGGQIICERFDELKEKVDYLLNNPAARKTIGERGYEFAKQFTKERFAEEWIALIKSLVA